MKKVIHKIVTIYKIYRTKLNINSSTKRSEKMEETERKMKLSEVKTRKYSFKKNTYPRFFCKMAFFFLDEMVLLYKFDHARM